MTANAPTEPNALKVPEKGPKFKGEALPPTGTFSHALEPRNFEETMALANILSKSDIVPKDFQGKPANILVAITLGREVGFGWAQALQNICVINGRPSIWGDGAVGLILASDVFEDSSDSFDPNLDGGTAIYKSKRKGKNWTVRTFSHNDAQKAGLLSKDTYVKYERRMLFKRAGAWAQRDDYADVLKGLRMADEEQDVPPIDVTPKHYAMPEAAATPTDHNPARESTAPIAGEVVDAEIPTSFLIEDVSHDKKKDEWRILIDGVSLIATEAQAKTAKELKKNGTKATYKADIGALSELTPVL